LPRDLALLAGARVIAATSKVRMKNFRAILKKSIPRP